MTIWELAETENRIKSSIIAIETRAIDLTLVTFFQLGNSIMTYYLIKNIIKKTG